MHISHLSLENFRNFARLDLELAPGRTVLYGGNAQGKTNLLEALSMFATARSVRASHERELIRWEAAPEEIPFARVKGSIERSQGSLQVEIVVQLARSLPSDGPASGDETPQLQKRVRVNGIPRRASDLIGEVNAVLFAPQDIELVHGPPPVRRRYLDITLSQADRVLLRELQRYTRVLSQRNHLLRAIREGRAGQEELSFWDGELVEAGSYIALRRTEAVQELGQLGQAIHMDLTGGQEELELAYLPSVPAAPGDSVDKVAEAFREALAKLRKREVLLGISLAGPHRDDFQFRANGADLAVFGSRGQQRTAALSLKLAEARFLSRHAGEQPLLLLDDVLSELDGFRRGYLLSSIEEYGQAILTTTDPERIDERFLAGADLLQVAQGRVERSAPNL